MNSRVYLDWNATAPLRSEARRAMLHAFDLAGNPSSVHSEGRAARAIVEKARGALAHALNVTAGDVVFTSGGTEANALALAPGLRIAGGAAIERLIVSAVEHPSVLSGGRFSRDRIALAPVTGQGVIDIQALTKLLASGPPALVSVMLANNETGAVQPISEVASLVHEAGGILHVDAVQALGRIPIDMRALGADLATVSGHKIGGPKGVGALIVVNGRLEGLPPLIAGGGQERNRRAGTENVSGIAGFGAAIETATTSLATERERQTRPRDQLETGLRSIPGARIFADGVARLPNTVLFAAPGLKSETAVIAFDLEGIAVSAGSACSSGKIQPSHVLSAMAVPPELARGAVRLSLGCGTEERDIVRCIEAWIKLATVLLKGDETQVERF